jgi:hypothetical protein
MGRGGADVLPASDGLLGSGGIEPEEMVREVPVVPHAAETDMGAHTMAAGYQLSHEEMGDREEDVVYRVIDAAIRDGRRIFSYSLENVHAAFNGFDQDGSGRMDIQGFEKAMHELDLGLTPDQIKEVFQASDTDGSGMIDYRAFADELHTKHGAAAQLEAASLEFTGTGTMRRSDIWRVDDDAEKLTKFITTGGATGGGPPNYLAKTTAFTAHTLGKKKQPVKRTERELQTYDKTKWCAEDREAARAMLVQMQFKYNFARNPRFPKIARDPSTNKPLVPLVHEDHFTVMPPVAEFTSYEAGGVYELVLEFQNRTAVGRRLRILQPDSPLFTMSLLRFPLEGGQVAPGMTAAALIRFSPDSFGDYDDVLRVETEAGMIEVPLRGRRQPPCLTLDERLDAGYGFVGDQISLMFEFTNTGGAGKFCLVPESWQDASEAMDIEDELNLGPFTVTPTAFELQPQESMALRVDFSPTEVGIREHSFLLLCDNCDVRKLRCYGGAVVPDVGITKFVQMDVTPGRDPPKTLDFSATTPNAMQIKQVVAENRNPLPLPFHWNTYKASLREGEGSDDMAAGLSVFSVSPNMGTLPPHSKMAFDVYFRPVEAAPYAGRMELFVEGIPQTDANGNLSYRDESMLAMRLQGTGCKSSAEIFPESVLFGAPLQLGSSYTRDLKLENMAGAPSYYTWLPQEEVQGEGAPVVLIEPRAGLLEQGVTMNLSLKLQPTRSGPFRTTMTCEIQHGQPLTLVVEGTVAGPMVRLNRPTINYGLVEVDKTSNAELIVSNLSSGVAASWGLDVADGSGNKGEFLFLPAGGIIAPGEQVSVMVKLTPNFEQRLRSTLACSVSGGETQYVNVQAEVQRPRCYVSAHDITMRTSEADPSCYVDVPVTSTFTITNANFLTATLAWEQVCIPEYDIVFHPPTAKLAANESIDVTVTFTARRPVGVIERLVKCRVEGMLLPVSIVLRAKTVGLTVKYGIQLQPQTLAESVMSVIPPLKAGVPGHEAPFSLVGGETKFDEPPKLELGDTPVYQSRSMVFFIENHTPIPAEYELRMKGFGEPQGIFSTTVAMQYTAGSRPNQQNMMNGTMNMTGGTTGGGGGSQSMSSTSNGPARSKKSNRGIRLGDDVETRSVRSRGTTNTKASSFGGGRRLLSNEVETTKRLVSKSGQERIAAEFKQGYMANALANQQGGVYALSNYGGHLEPWGVTFVEIVLHNDRCGDYEDTLVCEMTDSSGTISVDFPVHTRVIGLPLTLYPNITGTSRRKPNQHLLKLEEKMRATGCSQQEINLALGDQRVAQVSDNLDAVIGPIHTRGGGEALDEELKQWAFKSRYRTKTVPDNHSEAEAATWQIRFAGRAEGLEYVQQTMTVMNRGTTDIQLDFALFPHELGVHNLVEAEQTLVQQPAWAAELQKQEEEQQRIADAIEADRLLAIQQKKLDLMKAAAAAAMEAAADAEGGAEPAEGEEGAAELDDSAAKAKDKAAQALQSAMGAHMFALERKAKVARDAKEAAEKELLSLNRNKLAELKRTKVPTGSVHSILKAVLILLQLAKAKEVKDWKTCRKLACAMDFFPTVMAYDTSATIPAKRLARVQRYLAEAGGEEGAKQGSIVAWVLAKWLTNTLAVYEQEQLKVTAQKEAAAAAAAAAGEEPEAEEEAAEGAEGEGGEAAEGEEGGAEAEGQGDDDDDTDEEGEGGEDGGDGAAAADGEEGGDAAAEAEPEEEEEEEDIEDLPEEEPAAAASDWVSFDFPVYCPQKGELADPTGVFPAYEPRPFKLDPESALVPAEGEVTFTVTFDPATPHPVAHEWYMVGDAQYSVPEGEEPLPERTPAPLPPMFVALTAACVTPKLESAHKQLHFTSFANPATGPPPTVRAALLTNVTPAPVYFSLSVDDEQFFGIVSAELGIGGSELVGAADIAGGHVFLLQPGEKLRANVRFVPKKLAKKKEEDPNEPPKPLWKVREEQEAADLLVHDSEQTANLLMTFNNGRVQQLPIVASCIFPAVEPSPSTVDFGQLLVGRPMQRTVKIKNTSQAKLGWKLINSEDENFKVDIREGVLPPMIGGSPQETEITVTLTADREGVYDKIVQVQAAHGRGGVLRFKAVGSFDEAHERRAGRTGFASGGQYASSTSGGNDTAAW